MEQSLDHPPAPSPREAQAAETDRRIVAAAKAVFMADPNAPVSAIAERAGVGMAALYRRYPSKEALITHLYQVNLRQMQSALDDALADAGDPWDVFCRFVHRSLDLGGGSLSYRFAGAFVFSDEMARNSLRFLEGMDKLVVRARAAGVIRSDIGDGDLQWLWLTAQAIQVVDGDRSVQLRHRYLALLLDGLRAENASPLPGPAPTGTEYEDYWDRRHGGPVRPGRFADADAAAGDVAP